MDWTWGWPAVAAIATGVLAGGVIFAFLQIRQARKSTNAQLAAGLFKELRDYETVEKLRSIYDLKPDDLEDSQIDEKKIGYVLDRFELLGALVAKGIIDKKLAIEAYAGASALRCWYQLHKYIRKVRDERGYVCENYEDFARLSLDYFKKEGIQVKLYREGEKDKVIDLITELQKDEFRPRNFAEIKRDRENKKGKGEV
jgi:hypothetical protein